MVKIHVDIHLHQGFFDLSNTSMLEKRQIEIPLLTAYKVTVHAANTEIVTNKTQKSNFFLIIIFFLKLE